MTIWSWLKLFVAIWLLRKIAKIMGWLLVAAIVIAAWPVTLTAAVGGVSAWLRGWPPVKLYRTAAWTLIITGVWLAVLEVRSPGWAAAQVPVRVWEGGWHQLAAVTVVREFAQVAPVAVPAGLGLGGVLWNWRIYSITTGLGGFTASASITFDAKQWRRQVRTALRADRGTWLGAAAGAGWGHPGRRDHSRHRSSLASRVQHSLHGVCAAHGGGGFYGQREDELDDPAVGGLVHRHLAGVARGAGAPAAADRAGLQGRAGRPEQGGAHSAAALRSRGAAGGDLAG